MTDGNPSPSGYFTRTAFDAVQVNPVNSTGLAALGDDAREVEAGRVEIPAALEAAFREAIRRSRQSKTYYVKINKATDYDADYFRRQIFQFARDNGITCTMPRFIDGHYTKALDANGNFSFDPATRKEIKGTWVPANNVSKTWNVNRNVTFRFPPKKVDTTVTTTAGTPRAATPQSRGARIIDRNIAVSKG